MILATHCAVVSNIQAAPSESGDVPSDNLPTFDMKRARFEVKKFGIKGLQGSEKEAGMVDILVELGAKVCTCMQAQGDGLLMSCYLETI